VSAPETITSLEKLFITTRIFFENIITLADRTKKFTFSKMQDSSTPIFRNHTTFSDVISTASKFLDEGTAALETLITIHSE
jgi:hypothetical protein